MCHKSHTEGRATEDSSDQHSSGELECNCLFACMCICVCVFVCDRAQAVAKLPGSISILVRQKKEEKMV